MLYLSSGMLEKAWTFQKPKNKYTKHCILHPPDALIIILEIIILYGIIICRDTNTISGGRI